ncbi:MAG TPA: SCO family protein [Saprospiraceae bacterium]|nr:SCO family protein [Saprospiraceae bacterium]
MKQGSRIWFYLVIVVATAGLLAWGMEFYTHRLADLPVYGPKEKIGGEEKAFVIPPFELTSQDGGAFSSAVTAGKVTVTNFFFTSCPSICPRIMRNLQSVHELYRNDPDVMILSITVDPLRDTPERLLKYSENLNASTQQWRFLTGEKKGIYSLARHGYFLTASEGDGGEYDFIHSENIVLVDAIGQIRGYYNGLDAKSMNQLSEDIAKLKKDKS